MAQFDAINDAIDKKAEELLNKLVKLKKDAKKIISDFDFDRDNVKINININSDDFEKSLVNQLQDAVDRANKILVKKAKINLSNIKIDNESFLQNGEPQKILAYLDTIKSFDLGSVDKIEGYIYGLLNLIDKLEEKVDKFDISNFDKQLDILKKYDGFDLSLFDKIDVDSYKEKISDASLTTENAIKQIKAELRGFEIPEFKDFLDLWSEFQKGNKTKLDILRFDTSSMDIEKLKKFLSYVKEFASSQSRDRTFLKSYVEALNDAREQGQTSISPIKTDEVIKSSEALEKLSDEVDDLKSRISKAEFNIQYLNGFKSLIEGVRDSNKQLYEEFTSLMSALDEQMKGYETRLTELTTKQTEFGTKVQGGITVQQPQQSHVKQDTESRKENVEVINKQAEAEIKLSKAEEETAKNTYVYDDIVKKLTRILELEEKIKQGRDIINVMPINGAFLNKQYQLEDFATIYDKDFITKSKIKKSYGRYTKAQTRFKNNEVDQSYVDNAYSHFVQALTSNIKQKFVNDVTDYIRFGKESGNDVKDYLREILPKKMEGFINEYVDNLISRDKRYVNYKKEEQSRPLSYGQEISAIEHDIIKLGNGVNARTESFDDFDDITEDASHDLKSLLESNVTKDNITLMIEQICQLLNIEIPKSANVAQESLNNVFNDNNILHKQPSTIVQDTEDRKENIAVINEQTEAIAEVYRAYNKMNGIKGEKGISWFSTDFDTMMTYLQEHPDRELVKGNIDFSKLLNIDAQGALHNAITYLGDGSDEASVKITNVYNRIQELKDILAQNPDDALQKELHSLELEYDKLSEDTSNFYGTHTTNWFAIQAQEAGLLGVAIRNVIDDYDGLIDKPSTTIALFDISQLENQKRITDEVRGSVEQVKESIFDVKSAVSEDAIKFVDSKDVSDLEDELREVTEFDSLVKLTSEDASELAEKLRTVFAYAHENPDVLDNLFDYDENLVDVFDEKTNIGKYFKSLIDSTDFGVDEDQLEGIYVNLAEKLQDYEKQYIDHVTEKLRAAINGDGGDISSPVEEALSQKAESSKQATESIIEGQQRVQEEVKKTADEIHAANLQAQSHAENEDYSSITSNWINVQEEIKKTEAVKTEASEAILNQANEEANAVTETIAKESKEWKGAIEYAERYKNVIGEIEKIVKNIRTDKDGNKLISYVATGTNGSVTYGQSGADYLSLSSTVTNPKKDAKEELELKKQIVKAENDHIIAIAAREQAEQRAAEKKRKADEQYVQLWESLLNHRDAANRDEYNKRVDISNNAKDSFYQSFSSDHDLFSISEESLNVLIKQFTDGTIGAKEFDSATKQLFQNLIDYEQIATGNSKAFEAEQQRIFENSQAIKEANDWLYSWRADNLSSGSDHDLFFDTERTLSRMIKSLNDGEIGVDAFKAGLQSLVGYIAAYDEESRKAEETQRKISQAIFDTDVAINRLANENSTGVFNDALEKSKSSIADLNTELKNGNITLDEYKNNVSSIVSGLASIPKPQAGFIGGSTYAPTQQELNDEINTYNEVRAQAEKTRQREQELYDQQSKSIDEIRAKIKAFREDSSNAINEEGLFNLEVWLNRMNTALSNNRISPEQFIKKATQEIDNFEKTTQKLKQGADFKKFLEDIPADKVSLIAEKLGELEEKINSGMDTKAFKQAMQDIKKELSTVTTDSLKTDLITQANQIIADANSVKDSKVGYFEEVINKNNADLQSWIEKLKSGEMTTDAFKNKIAQMQKTLADTKWDKYSHVTDSFVVNTNNIQEVRDKLAEAAKSMDGFVESTFKYNKAGTQMTFDVKNANGTIEQHIVKLNKATHAIEQFKVAQSDNGLKQLMSGLKGEAGNLLYMVAGVRGVDMAVRQAISSAKAGFQTLKEYDSALTNISYTMDITKKQLDDMGKSALQMADDMKMSVQNATQIYQIYANLSTTPEQIAELSKPTAILSNISGVNAATAADEIQAAQLQFDLAEEKAMHIVDVYDYISSRIAMSYDKGVEGMAQAVQSAGEVAKTAGLSLEQLSAITAKSMESTRRSGSEIAGALRTIMVRLSKASKLDDTIDPETISQAAAALSKVGIATYDTEGNYRSFTKIMEDLAAKWDDLTDAEQANIAFAAAA